MSQPFPWHLLVPFSGWYSLLTLRPEAHAALFIPTTALNRIAVAWLLLAPVAAILLSHYYSPDAAFYFNTVSSIFGIYYKTRIAPKQNMERTKRQERTALELCGQGHYNRVVEMIGLMPVMLADREEALLHMRKARRAYVGMLEEMNRAFLETRLQSG
ncbi:hypothetical protein PG996_000054 [Apiospora saccharicola]|uniref:Uncharacterized protein n=1 Tax=Apiospora saccharicola TaxID=335842 RepID=A0ABR1WGQ6_9PEZI